MEDISEWFEFLKELGIPVKKDTEGPLEYFFDDEPLDRILYGEDRKGPTSANLFLPAKRNIVNIAQAYKDGDIQSVLDRFSELGENGLAMSIDTCFELALMIKMIIPHYPNPKLSFNLLALDPLICQIWDLAATKKDKRLQEAVGVSLYRWYEHQQRFEDARQVLTILLEMDREKSDRLDEAVLTNNLGFEYLFEGKYRDAMPLFEKSARLFKEVNNEFEHFNVRANYWMCRLECDDFVEIESLEGELKTIAKLLGPQTDWRARKPLILGAKLEERRGNIHLAMQLVEKAIEVGKKANTRYPESDGRYLEHLKKRLDVVT